LLTTDPSNQKGDEIHAVYDHRRTAVAVDPWLLDARGRKLDPRTAGHRPRGIPCQPDYRSPGSLSRVTLVGRSLATSQLDRQGASLPRAFPSELLKNLHSIDSM